MASERRVYTIQDRRRVLSLYAGGLSIRDVRSRTRIPYTTLRDWLCAAGKVRDRSHGQMILKTGHVWATPDAIDDIRDSIARGERTAAIARRYGVTAVALLHVAKRHGIRRDRETELRRTANHPRTKQGARRLERIRQLCVLEKRGMTRDEMSPIIGVSTKTLYEMSRTPLAAALRVFVHGRADEPKAPHARAMYNVQGLPVSEIAKVLDADEATIRQWLRLDANPRATLTPDQVRAMRAYRRDHPTASYPVIGAMFGVSKTTARSVCTGQVYADVPDLPSERFSTPVASLPAPMPETGASGREGGKSGVSGDGEGTA